jgi:hypothetical protein
MATTPKAGRPQAQGQGQEYLLEQRVHEFKSVTDDIYSIIEDIVTAGAQILYMRYIESQKRPYACRTLARELVLNASWAAFPLDSTEIFAEPDDDLALPQIDEWAGGVMPVRNSDATSLRCSVTPQREFRKTQTLHRAHQLTEESPATTTGRSPAVARPTVASMPRAARDATKPRRPPPVKTEAEIITKMFEQARKRTNVATKAVTVDADFTVIQITEPKGLPPALIVPKVTTKSKPPAKPAAAVAVTRKPAAIGRTDQKKRRKPQSFLIQPDVPVFDEEVANISYSDRFVCAPGVTFKDGSTVKSRPPVVDNAQMTRTQYDAYLQEMKRSGE